MKTNNLASTGLTGMALERGMYAYLSVHYKVLYYASKKECSKIIQRTFKEHSKSIPRTFKELSMSV